MSNDFYHGNLHLIPYACWVMNICRILEWLKDCVPLTAGSCCTELCVKSMEQYVQEEEGNSILKTVLSLQDMRL